MNCASGGLSEKDEADDPSVNLEPGYRVANDNYWMTPQAMRPPAFPAGSLL